MLGCMEQCDKCYYYKKADSYKECHRYPPLLVPNKTFSWGYLIARPEVDPKEWCGEFKEKEIEEEVTIKPNMLSQRDVIERVGGISPETLWGWVRSDTFPAPIFKKSDFQGWIESEVEEWLQYRAGIKYKE